MPLSDLPLIPSVDIEYKSSFTTADDAVTNYSNGVHCPSEDGASIFVANEEYIAQYALPASRNAITLGTDADELTAIQAPVRITGGVTDNGDGTTSFNRLDPRITTDRFRIVGMYHKGGKLYVNHLDWYDASNGARIHTTFVVQDASDLAGSAIVSNYALNGISRQSGMMMEVPLDYQAVFGGELTMWAPSESIVGRHDMGPAYRALDWTDFDVADDGDGNKPLNGPSHMNYNSSSLDASGLPKVFYDKTEYPASLIQPLYPYIQNFSTQDYLENYAIDKGDGTFTQNNLWSILSKVACAFVMEGTRTLVVVSPHVGGSRKGQRTLGAAMPSGVNRGIIYKGKPWLYVDDATGYQLQTEDEPGHSPAIEDDVCHNIFLFDLLDLEEVQAGNLDAWNVRPYAIQTMDQPIVGTLEDPLSYYPNAGHFNYTSGELTLAYPKAVQLGAYDVRPLFNTYTFTKSKPVITVDGDLVFNIFQGDSFSPPIVSAEDVYGNDITNDILVTGTIDTSSIGLHTLDHNVVDADGLAAETVTIKVFVNQSSATERRVQLTSIATGNTATNQQLVVKDIHVPAEFWSIVSESGNDIQICLGDDKSNRLPVHKAVFDKAGQELLLISKVATYDGTALPIYLYYGGAEEVLDNTSPYHGSKVFENTYSHIRFESGSMVDVSEKETPSTGGTITVNSETHNATITGGTYGAIRATFDSTDGVDMSQGYRISYRGRLQNAANDAYVFDESTNSRLSLKRIWNTSDLTLEHNGNTTTISGGLSAFNNQTAWWDFFWNNATNTFKIFKNNAEVATISMSTTPSNDLGYMRFFGAEGANFDVINFRQFEFSGDPSEGKIENDYLTRATDTFWTTGTPSDYGEGGGGFTTGGVVAAASGVASTVIEAENLINASLVNTAEGHAVAVVEGVSLITADLNTVLEGESLLSVNGHTVNEGDVVVALTGEAALMIQGTSNQPPSPITPTIKVRSGISLSINETSTTNVLFGLRNKIEIDIEEHFENGTVDNQILADVVEMDLHLQPVGVTVTSNNSEGSEITWNPGGFALDLGAVAGVYGNQRLTLVAKKANGDAFLVLDPSGRANRLQLIFRSIGLPN